MNSFQNDNASINDTNPVFKIQIMGVDSKELKVKDLSLIKSKAVLQYLPLTTDKHELNYRFYTYSDEYLSWAAQYKRQGYEEMTDGGWGKFELVRVIYVSSSLGNLGYVPPPPTIQKGMVDRIPGRMGPPQYRI